MLNPNITYRVTGRYMDGQKVVGYHLIGEDGTQHRLSRDNVIYLIGNGLVENMRLQTGADGEIIPRGKGVNLNNLPAYDAKKDVYRDNASSRSVANTGVKVNNNKAPNASPMGQYRLVKRVMRGQQCIGYEIQDCSGKCIRKNKDLVIELALKRLISNAIVQKHIKENGEHYLGLRGVNCDLRKLPMLIVTDQGKIVDPLADRTKLTVRAVCLKRAGVIRELTTNSSKTFNAGSYLVCNPDGSFEIENRDYITSNYRPDHERAYAVCDSYLANSINYVIEIFGADIIKLNPTIIKNWVILKPIDVIA